MDPVTVPREPTRPHPTRACRVCGCTQDRACPGRCWWAEWDLCSSCATQAEEIDS